MKQQKIMIAKIFIQMMINRNKKIYLPNGKNSQKMQLNKMQFKTQLNMKKNSFPQQDDKQKKGQKHQMFNKQNMLNNIITNLQ